LSQARQWATLEGMVALIVGMLICIGLALAVVGLVAVPARREGRDVLTPRGEEVVAAIRAQATGTSGEPRDGDVATAAGEESTSADASRPDPSRAAVSRADMSSADGNVEGGVRERTESRAG
jgi:hypothetical protein